MEAFWAPLGWVFLAELGDKTQLVALCFATRFRVMTVMSGVFVATLLVHVFSVLLGQLADTLMPQAWINLAAGLSLIAFGMWTLRGDENDDESCKNKQGRYPFLIVATTFFLAELGDKTMLVTVQQAAINPRDFYAVWIGSSLGMVVSDGLAIAVGYFFGKKLPERLVKIIAACIFFIFGIITTVHGAMELPLYSWLIAIVIPSVLALFFFRKPKNEIPLSLMPEPEDKELESVELLRK